MADLDLSYKPVSNAEYESVKDKLSQVARCIGQPSLRAEAIFYKVPFEEVPELVAGRRVFIQKGNAYIATHQLVSLVINQFRSNLSKALALTNRKWTSMIREQEKDRLTPIVEALSTSYLGPDYSQPPEHTEISLKDIDQVAKTSFPLCMRHLFEKLREDHLLKHGGRMQLGLFLKGVGLKLDDVLAFWTEKLVLKILTRNMRMAYATIMGKKEREYEENFRAALGKMGVGNFVVEDVIGKVRNRHYQLACTLTFEAIHGASCNVGINHPNQYYNDSKKMLESRNSCNSLA